MRIDHKNFIIESDGMCLTLYRKGVWGKKSNTPGAERKTVVGYFSNLEPLCSRLIEELTAESDIEDIQGLVNILKQIHADILLLCSSLGSTWKPLEEED